MVVANTRTSVDVLWQDGTLQHGIPSATLVPFEIVNEQEFFPGEHVVENTLPFDTGDHDAETSIILNSDIAADETGSTRRAGVIRSLDYKEQTVCVSWFKAGMCTDKAREVECTDTVSAYDLKLNDCSPYYGEIVVRLQSGSTDDGGNAALHGKRKYKKKKNVVDADLSWVGRIVDVPDGQVQVNWGDGSMSTVRRFFFSFRSYD
jgi:ubiquitin-conjugating enzyme E2 O